MQKLFIQYQKLDQIDCIVSSVKNISCCDTKAKDVSF